MGALIGFFGVLIGIFGIVIQEILVGKREREARACEVKREHYENLIKVIVEGIHTVRTKGEPTSAAFKAKLDEAVNVLWLYASSEVMKYIDEYLFSQKPTTLDNLMQAMRKDLKLPTMEKPVTWIRAT